MTQQLNTSVSTSAIRTPCTTPALWVVVCGCKPVAFIALQVACDTVPVHVLQDALTLM